MSNLIELLKHKMADHVLRRKLLHTVSIYFTFIAVGMNCSQIGPAFLDLQLISNTNTEQASAYITATSVGCLVGSLSMGFIYGRWNKHLTLCVYLLGTAVSVTAVPWCTSYILMVVMHGLAGVFRSSCSTAVTADIIRTWAPNSRLFILLQYFSFSVGGIITPLITRPFLAPKQATNETATKKNDTLFEPKDHGILNGRNNSLVEPVTHVQFAYLISGVWFAIAMCVFLVQYCTLRTEHTDNIQGTYENFDKPLPRAIVIVTVAMLLSVFFFSVSVQKSLASYILSFVVTYLDWTKSAGANLTMVFWICHASSKFVSFFYTNFVSPFKVLLLSAILTVVLAIGNILSSINQFEIGVWICTGGTAFCASVQVPTLYAWIEEKILRVTPRMVSMFNLAITFTGMVNPPILGYLMQQVSEMWLLYLVLVDAVAVLGTLLAVFMWAKLVVQPQQARQRLASNLG